LPERSRVESAGVLRLHLPRFARQIPLEDDKHLEIASKPTVSLIAFLTLELRIEAAQSLKDRRQVVRSLKDRLRTGFNISVAELEPGTLWNQATIGVVSISSSRDYLDGLMKNVERQAARIANNHGAEIVDSYLEFL
jgi:uncharacterized protein YlxP (DUF503 family)